jgi:hypothetical protein
MVKYRRKHKLAAITLRRTMATESKKSPSGKQVRLTSLSKCAG